MKSSACLLGLVAVFATSFLLPSVAHAQVDGGRRFGLGVSVGYPDVGVSARYVLSERLSLQFGLSFLYRDGRIGSGPSNQDGGLRLRADLLFRPGTLARGSVAELGWYVGPGLYAGFSDREPLRMGVEAVVGLSLRFRNAPLELAVEAAPRLGILDGTGVRASFELGGSLYARYYF